MSPDPIVGLLFTLFLPFIFLGLLGNVIGLKPNQSMAPVRLLAMAMWNFTVFALRIICEWFIYLLAGRSIAIGRKKVRIRFDK